MIIQLVLGFTLLCGHYAKRNHANFCMDREINQQVKLPFDTRIYSVYEGQNFHISTDVFAFTFDGTFDEIPQHGSLKFTVLSADEDRSALVTVQPSTIKYIIFNHKNGDWVSQEIDLGFYPWNDLSDCLGLDCFPAEPYWTTKIYINGKLSRDYGEILFYNFWRTDSLKVIFKAYPSYVHYFWPRDSHFRQRLNINFYVSTIKSAKGLSARKMKDTNIIEFSGRTDKTANFKFLRDDKKDEFDVSFFK